MRWVLALAAPTAIIVVWALFVSPKAKVEAARSLRLAIEVAVWTAAGIALAAAGRLTWGIAFAIVAAISGTFNYVWG